MKFRILGVHTSFPVRSLFTLALVLGLHGSSSLASGPIDICSLNLEQQAEFSAYARGLNSHEINRILRPLDSADHQVLKEKQARIVQAFIDAIPEGPRPEPVALEARTSQVSTLFFTTEGMSPEALKQIQGEEYLGILNVVLLEDLKMGVLVSLTGKSHSDLAELVDDEKRVLGGTRNFYGLEWVNSVTFEHLPGMTLLERFYPLDIYMLGTLPQASSSPQQARVPVQAPAKEPSRKGPSIYDPAIEEPFVDASTRGLLFAALRRNTLERPLFDAMIRALSLGGMESPALINRDDRLPVFNIFVQMKGQQVPEGLDDVDSVRRLDSMTPDQVTFRIQKARIGTIALLTLFRETIKIREY